MCHAPRFYLLEPAHSCYLHCAEYHPEMRIPRRRIRPNPGAIAEIQNWRMGAEPLPLYGHTSFLTVVDQNLREIFETFVTKKLQFLPILLHKFLRNRKAGTIIGEGDYSADTLISSTHSVLNNLNERGIVDVEKSQILWDQGKIIRIGRFAATFENAVECPIVSDPRWWARIFFREDVVEAIRKAKLPKIKIIDPFEPGLGEY